MSERPEQIKHQIHTVLLTASKRQGVALGNDDQGHAIKIWLLTPRAVEKGMEKLRAVARACGGAPKRDILRAERVCRLDVSTNNSREWVLR